jgi:hypothetical protein
MLDIRMMFSELVSGQTLFLDKFPNSCKSKTTRCHQFFRVTVDLLALNDKYLKRKDQNKCFGGQFWICLNGAKCSLKDAKCSPNGAKCSLKGAKYTLKVPKNPLDGMNRDVS